MTPEQPHDPLIAELRQEYLSELSAGAQPRVGQYVSRVPEDRQRELLLVLVRAELEYARRQDEAFESGSLMDRFAGHEQTVLGLLEEIATDQAEDLDTSVAGGEDPSRITAGDEDEDRTMDWDASAAAASDAPAQQPFRRFRLERVLGRGAFGTVYLAHDQQLDRAVALKVPRHGVIVDEEDANRFLREARAAAQLQHPHIVPVYEANCEEGNYYIASAYVAGVTLREKIKEDAGITFQQAARLIAAMAEALHYAHNRGVIHRDVKPDNVMIDGDGEPRIMDFGLARRHDGEAMRTQEGVRMGTPAYMSPEQAKGQSHLADARSDLWSLGVMLYELLAGKRPFEGSANDVLAALLQDDPASPRRHNARIPRDLETICMKCLAKDPEKRYPSCQHLADELRRWLRGEPIQARPLGVMGRAYRWSRRHPVAASVLGIVVSCVVAAAVYWQTRPAYLDLSVSPAESRVTLDGEPVALTDGRALVPYAPGRYTLSAEAEGFAPREQDVLLVRGRDNAQVVSIELQSLFGHVQLDSDPSGAQVEVLDQQGRSVGQGATPYHSPRLPSGKYTLKLNKDLFKPLETTVEIPSGDRVTSLPPLKLESTVQGAASLDRFVRMYRRLSQPIKQPWNFTEIPLDQVLKHIGAMEGVEIRIDYRSLNDANLVPANILITESATSSTLDVALGRMLAQFEMGYVPTLTEEGAVILITSLDVAYSRMETIIYPVRDVVTMGRYFSSELAPDFDSLMEAIKVHVDPESWDDAGGLGSISPVDDPIAVAVTQSWRSHQKVYLYLNDLRRARSAAAKKTGKQDAKRNALAGPVPAALSQELITNRIRESEERLRLLTEALSRTVGESQWNGAPLSQALKDLQQQTSIAFLIDAGALRKVGASPNTRVQLAVAKTSLDQVLRRLLDPLRLGVAPVIDYDRVMLRVTSRDKAQATSETVVYALQEMFIDPVLPSVSQYDLFADGVEARMAQTDDSTMTRHLEHFALSVRTSWDAHLKIHAWLEERRRHFKLLPKTKFLPGKTPDAQEVLSHLEQRFKQCSKSDPLDLETSIVRRLLVDFQRAYLGTPEAARAEAMLQQLPWPVRTLRRANIDELELRAAGHGDATAAPPRIVAIFGGSLLNHWEWVYDVAFHPQGKLIASASFDTRVNLWDPNTGRLVHSLAGHSKAVVSIDFSPDGKVLASAGSDQAVILWDAFSGKPLHTLRGHGKTVLKVIFLGKNRLASGSSDKTIRVWDTDTGQLVRTIKTPSTVRALAINGDEDLLAVGMSNGSIGLWKTSDYSLSSTLPGHQGGVRNVAFSPGGKQLASGGDDGHLRMWEVASGKELLSFRPGASRVRGFAYNPSGDLLAVEGRDQIVGIFSVTSGKAVMSLQSHNHSISDVAFSPDGAMLVSSGGDATVRIAPLPKTRPKQFSWPDPFPDGRRDTSYSIYSDPQRPSWKKRNAWVSSVDVSPDGLNIASLGADRYVKLWSLATGRRRTLGSHDAFGRCITFGPYSQFLASSDYHGTARMWNLLSQSGQPLLRLTRQPIECVRFSPHGTSVAYTFGSSAGLAGTGGPKQFTGHRDGIRRIAFSPDGRLLATASRDKTVGIWDVTTGKSQNFLRGHTDRVWSVAFSPDGKTLASAGYDYTIRLWDVATGKAKPPIARHRMAALCVAYRPDGKQLASSANDGTVRLWDAETLEPEGVFQLGPRQGEISEVVYTPDGEHLVTANANGTVYVLALGQSDEDQD